MRCMVGDGLTLLDNWSKNETAIVLFADKGLRRIGNVRIVSVSYEQESVTVEMDDGAEAEFYLVDTDMCQGVNSETLIAEYADLGWKSALGIRFPNGKGGGLTFAEPGSSLTLAGVVVRLRRLFAGRRRF